MTSYFKNLLPAMGFSPKPKAKKFFYSNEGNSIVLDQAISDLADISGETISSVIEGALIDRLLPSDDLARQLYCRVLVGAKNQIPDGIRETLEQVFRDEAAGTEARARHDNNRLLVILARDLTHEHNTRVESATSSGASILPHLLSNWGTTCSAMEEDSYPDLAMKGRELASSLTDNPSGFPASAAVDLILLGWDSVGYRSSTFRFLASLMEVICPWEDTPLDRQRFKVACEEVMAGWAVTDARDAAEVAEKNKIETVRTLCRYRLADGAYVTVPSDWPIINPETGTRSHYAAALEVKNGARYGAPHFLVFLDHPASEMSDEEIKKTIARAKDVWPPFAAMYSDHVDLRYGPDGGVLNQEEHLNSPIASFFPILDAATSGFAEPPFGAVIQRAGEEAQEETR